MISKVFMICDAYEAGYGKGQQLRETVNPYLETTECHEAWQIGYSLGEKRAKEAKPVRVWGWVWKDKLEDDCYVPSYTPAGPYSKGQLLALVHPDDLHNPLQNTEWHHVKALSEDPCPNCMKGSVCRTPACGRLKLPLDHPLRNSK